jgi:hypothetical protein
VTSTDVRPPPVRRVPADGLWLVVALAVLAVASPAASDRAVPGWDRAVWAAVNDRTVLPYAVVGR